MTRFTCNYAFLKLYINSKNTELIDLYKKQIQKHNQETISNHFPNSGFDIILPETITFNEKYTTKMVDMQIKTEMSHWDTKSNKTMTGFIVVPRSSMSKTELMLANHIGIIDSGYRGSLIGAFRWLTHNAASTEYSIPKHTRLLQICHPSLCPIIVELVDNEEELSTTERGEGAFGSTGICCDDEDEPDNECKEMREK